ncbi:MAG: hypothetical protein ACOY3I_02905 [Verrucomicrobiota bacterium]
MKLARCTQVVYGSTAVANTNDKTVSYTYDNVGNRLTQTTKINNQVTETLTYIYGSESRLLKVTDQTSHTTSGMPFLKDIPLLGYLFKSDSKSNTKSELVILIQPVILENNEQVVKFTKEETDKTIDLPPINWTG